MKIGFCYDIPENHPRAGDLDDITAEYESEETIEALTEMMAEIGEVIQFPYHQQIFDDLREQKPDVVFNIVESWGSRNRESYIPNICEMLEISYTGSDGLALGISLDKGLTKEIAQSRGINTPEFKIIKNVRQLDEVRGNLKIDYPVFVKPNSEGSSIGIRRSSRVNNFDGLYQTGKKLLNKYQTPIIIEEFLPGREFVVALLGNGEPEIFPVAEIVVEGDVSFYSYEFKGKHQKTIKCPVNIENKIKNKMISDTLEIFKVLGCRDIARADFKLDKQGRVHFLEINPLPGLSPFYSVYPEQAQKAGYRPEEIIKKLIEFALSREIDRRKIKNV